MISKTTDMPQNVNISPKDLFFSYLNSGYPVPYQLAHDGFKDALVVREDSLREYYMAALSHAVMASDPLPETIKGMLDASFALDNYKPKLVPKLRLSRPTVSYGGSGKKGLKTVNLSSLSAFVAACEGINIAKYCSPGTSSLSGSQDFIEILGANLSHSSKMMTQIMDETGVGFFCLERVVPKFSSIYTGIFMAPHALSFGLAATTRYFETDALVYGFAGKDIKKSFEVIRSIIDVKSLTVLNTAIENGLYIDELTNFGSISIIASNKDKRHEISSKILSESCNISDDEDISVISQGIDQVDNCRKGLSGLIGNNRLSKQIALNATILVWSLDKSIDFDTQYSKCLAIIESGEPVLRMRKFIEKTCGDIEKFDSLTAEIYKEKMYV